MVMNDKLKDIIKNAKPCDSSLVFDYILIIPTNSIYDGFYGVNGYNNMFVIGCVNDSYYRLDSGDDNAYGDSLYINNLRYLNFDVPTEFDGECIRVFSNGFKMPAPAASSIIVEGL